MTVLPVAAAQAGHAEGPVVSCRGVSKAFGAVQALDAAELEVRRGEIVALVGENGAGKTTLVRIIAGELAADAGKVAAGESVALVRQELSMAGGLSVLENIVFGAEPARRAGVIDWRAARRRATALIEATGLTVPLEADAAGLAPALQQRAELLRALHRGARVLLLDEPTSYLSPRDVDSLFGVIRRLAAAGISAVFISHKLGEVAGHCDRVSVLRGGRNAGEFTSRPFSLPAIGRAMTGEGLPPRSRREASARAAGRQPAALSVAGGKLTVADGEIAGVAGMAGSGQDQLAETVAGLRRHPGYEPVSILGQDVTGQKVWARRARGLRVIPASARASGCAVSEPLAANILTSEVPAQARGRLGTVHRHNAALLAARVIADSDVRAASPAQPAAELSGGNLQRLVAGRELGSGGRVLVAHEPTRGVDFRAAAAIRSRIRGFADDGGAVLLISSDLEELLELSDTVQVLFEGRLSGPHQAGTLTLGRLGEMLGGLLA